MKRNKIQGAGVAKRSGVRRRAKKPRVYKQKPHHAKPFRLRHVGLLLISLALCVILILQLGLQMGRDNSSSNTIAPPRVTQKQKSGLTIIRSSYGFSLASDANSFSIAATTVDAKGNAKSIPTSDLRSVEPINSAVIRPLAGTESGPAAAAQVSVQITPDVNALAQLKSQPANAGKTDGELAAIAFPISQNIGFNTAVVSSASDTLNGVAVQKTVYQYTSKLGSNTVTYEVNWSGSAGGRMFVLRLQGLVGGSVTPDLFQPVIDSFNIDNSQKVLGASIDNMGSALFPKAFAAKPKPLDTKYISDLVSPSVVKIYHIVCYGISMDAAEAIPYGCDLGSGSGFIASSDGYIATNGHVVASDPAGLLVKDILSSSTSFATFLNFLNTEANLGWTPAQIIQITASAQARADIVTKIYDLPAGSIKLANKHERVIVAIGNKPPDIKSFTDLDKIVNNFDDTDTLKSAEIVASDYSSKDLDVNLPAGKGFESNDAALLKIKVNNAPALSLISSNQISQNQSILLFGYPGDADNELVNNDTISPSVTNGTISSIREASGKSGKLFQTNADASHGNSGGPAIT
ncbi:MAG: trypsin-like peptidase domain-containing protein, partial [Candidatus Saccharimonadales bacterium]